MLNQSSPVLQKWQELSQREQRLLSFLALFLLLALMYLLIWSPLQSAKEQAQADLLREQQQWQWLQEQIPAWQQVQSEQAPSVKALGSQNELMAQLQSSLRQFSLQSQLETLSLTQKGVKASFKQVDAQRLFKWIEHNERSGVKLVKLTIAPESAGMVKASLEWGL